MRRAALAVISTVAVMVLLLSFKTHTSAQAVRQVTVSTPTTGGGAGTAGPASPAATATTGTATTGTPTTAGTRTVTGDAVDTRYGPVQVQITLSGGRITAATAVVYPQDNGRDAEINSYAIPQLDAETQQAGNASIDMVSGATYTSDGYVQSLQSALDKAGA